MANVTPPYADPGRASFEELDTYLQNYLLAGQHPPLAPGIGMPLANNSDFAQFSVLGVNASGNLTMATWGDAAAAATCKITFSDVGVAAEEIVIGDITYVMAVAPADAYEVDIGADVATSAANLAAAINAGVGEGTVYGEGTVAHPEVVATAALGVVTITARQVGAAANDIPVSTDSAAHIAVATGGMTGGRDVGGVQPRFVLAQAASLGSTGTGNGVCWYTGCFNLDALVWDASFDTDAKKKAAFEGAPTPTQIIVAKR